MPDWLGVALAQLALAPPGWGGALLGGLARSVQIAAGAYALGLCIGLLGALGKLHGGFALRWTLEIYTTLMRAVPELVLILLLYYAGSGLVNRLLEAAGQRPIDIGGVAAGIVVLGIVMGAYATEVIRGAIRSVPPGLVEAATAFGMTRSKALRRIVLPSMLPLALPGLSNLWLIVIKDTALLAVVGFEELATVARQAAGSTRDYLLFFVAAAGLYLALTLVSNVVIRRIEARVVRGRRDPGAMHG